MEMNAVYCKSKPKYLNLIEHQNLVKSKILSTADRCRSPFQLSSVPSPATEFNVYFIYLMKREQRDENSRTELLQKNYIL